MGSPSYMSLPENHTSDLTSARSFPAPVEVARIAALTSPVVRNLNITQAYYELSAAFAARTGTGANWCTFAAWASKQAGQTIRREDLLRTLEALLKTRLEVSQAVSVVAALAQQLGVRQSIEQIRQSVLVSLMTSVADRASEAVSRGNLKVFAEIGAVFARFNTICLNDQTYTDANLRQVLQPLRPGDPPLGQGYLRRAFAHYYESLFEADSKKQAELQLLATLEIGFHEQTRLQPDIADSLNAMPIDPKEVKKRLLATLFPEKAYLDQFRIFMLEFLRRTTLLDQAIKTLTDRASQQVQAALTTHLMTITLPPDRRLQLGKDLPDPFPARLQTLLHPDLRALLASVDPTPDSLGETGAADWANLPERMHFIADLFRCYQENDILLKTPVFTAEQVTAIKAGRVPGGRL